MTQSVVGSNKILIAYASDSFTQSFYDALSAVAQERIYIEMIEAPAFEKFQSFQKKLISNNWPVFYAIDGKRVVGWADITPATNPRLAHRGFLGMGLIESYRGQGLGTQLLEAVLNHAHKIGLEKVELSVYSENEPAIKLYEKMGFAREGLIKHYRKLDGRYFDCLSMGKFL